MDSCFGCTNSFPEHARMTMESDRADVLSEFEKGRNDWPETSKRLEKIQTKYLKCVDCLLRTDEQ